MGLSFAIPIDLAVQIKDELMKNGKVSRGRLGILMQQLTPELAKSFNLKEAKGALIAQIEKDGPADKAGLRDGDIVISAGGKKIRTEKDLNEVVSKAKGSLAVLVDRNGSREFIPVKLSDEVKK